MIKWNGYTIKEVNYDSIPEGLFSGIICSGAEDLPEELKILSVGYYEVLELNQYFKMSDGKVKYGGGMSVYYPFGKKSVIRDYLEIKWERDYQEEKAEILAEITVFNNDMNVELSFDEGLATMKNYYNKTIQVKHIHNFDDGCIEYVLLLDGRFDTDIYYIAEKGIFSANDGMDSYGNHDTMKEAIKSYMDSCYKYSTDDEEYNVNCSNCGDGGCIHCEPHRFL